MTMKKIALSLLFILGSWAAMAQAVKSTTELVGTWNGKLTVGPSSLTIVLNIEQADGYVVCTLDSPDQGAKGIGCYKLLLNDQAISVTIPTIGASFTAELQAGELVGSFSQSGINIPLSLKRGEYKPNRPQEPLKPYPYKTEEVTFVNEADHATLAGTLTYPIGYEELTNTPVVVLISGSGLQNRDEELFGHKPFLVIADHLAHHGIASLRYDDRAFGASTGGDRIHDKATTLDYKRDAAAAIEYLRGMNKFGPIGALGHSEGGSIVFMLAADGEVDFIVSLAGVGVKGDVALTAQYNHIMRANGQPYDITVEQYREIVAQAPQSDWLDWFLNYDPTADIAATLCPALVLNGDKDAQVISSLNLPAIERSLPHNDLSVLKEYPTLNHLFQHSQTGLPAEYGTIEETISPEVLTDISEWINHLPQ